MNIERLRVLAAYVRELPPKKFDMRDFVRSRTGGDFSAALSELLDPRCGTRGCLAGYALALWARPGTPFAKHTNARLAGDLLGLSLEVAEELFVSQDAELSDATPEQAACVLDHLVKTSKVDWSIINAR